MKRCEIKRLDKLWGEIIKAKDGHKCQKCGNAAYLNAHHIVGRSNYKVRWEVENGITLCPKCHFWIEQHAHAGNEFLERTIGKVKLDFLENMSGKLNQCKIEFDIIKKVLETSKKELDKKK